MLMNCPYCSKRIVTEVEHESTWIGIMLSILLFLIFKIFSFPLIMILIPLTQKTNHKCTNCLNNVGSRTFYDMLSLTDKIFTVNIGNFALIFTRKTLFGAFLFSLFSIIIYFYIANADFSRGSKK